MTTAHHIDADSVLIKELPCVDHSKIGMLQLNAPQTLNGLTLEMTRRLKCQLDLWANDASVALVVMRGSGDKAFCAGGDLHALHQTMRQDQTGLPVEKQYAATFFAEEYALDYLIHTYPKPVLVWGDGIVMGGGMGLMMGASHRVVTETTRLAMPEISIGLFPDVGGTWLLNRLPGNTGLFLGLTGAQLNAHDALFAGMADYHLSRSAWDNLLKTLVSVSWQKLPTNHSTLETRASTYMSDFCHEQLHQLLVELHTAADATHTPFQTHFAYIRQLCGGSNLERIVDDILKLAHHSDSWLQRAAHTLSKGSPGSARLTFTLLKHNKYLSLADVYRVEWLAGLIAAKHGDFAEGIRALLIDKDKTPAWNPPTLALASEQWVKKFFTLPFPAEQHPLYRLGDHA